MSGLGKADKEFVIKLRLELNKLKDKKNFLDMNKVSKNTKSYAKLQQQIFDKRTALNKALTVSNKKEILSTKYQRQMSHLTGLAGSNVKEIKAMYAGVGDSVKGLTKSQNLDEYYAQSIKDYKTLNKLAKNVLPSGSPVKQRPTQDLNQKKAKKYWDSYYEGSQRAYKSTTGFSKVLKKINKRIPFQGWALTLMFLGMSIKRISMSITKDAVGAFNEVMATQYEASTATSELSGAWKYLQFTIGDSINTLLGGLLPTIVSIILIIVNWMNQHKKLTASILLIAIALGTLFIIIGTGVLVIAALITAFLILDAVFLFVFGAGFLAVASVFLAIVAALIAAFIMLWVTNLGSFQDIVKDAFGIAWKIMSTVFKSLFKIVSAVFKFIYYLLTGEWGKAWDQLIIILKESLLILVTIIVGQLVMVWNLVVGYFSMIQDLFYRIVVLGVTSLVQKLLNFIVNSLNDAIGLFNNIFGTEFGQINYTFTFADDLKKDYDSKDTLYDKAGISSDLFSEFIDYADETLDGVFKIDEKITETVDKPKEDDPESKSLLEQLNETIGNLNETLKDKTNLNNVGNNGSDSNTTLNINEVSVHTDKLEELLDELKRGV